MRRIQAVIFDLDGLLVDSEPLWTESEIEIFGTVGIELDADKCRQTVGIGLEEVVEVRYRQKPWADKSKKQVAEEIHRRLVELLREKGRPMPGARQAIAFAQEKGVRIGMATASDADLIEAMLDVLGERDAFHHIQSASDLEHKKPHPQVYLVCADALGVDPAHCLALEDSIPGLISAKAAGMRAVAVPDPAIAEDPRLSIADARLSTLAGLGQDVWNRLENMQKW
jgi:sugar-phosphatase